MAGLAQVWRRVSPARGGAYDPVSAARATSGLGLALHQLAADDMLAAGEVWVSGEVLTHSRDSLTAFASKLRQRR